MENGYKTSNKEEQVSKKELTMFKKIEYTDTQKTLYGCTKKTPFFIDVPKMNYLQFNGNGHPSENDYQIACETLFNIAYIIKFKIAREKMKIDFKVNPMEVTWFLDKSGDKIKFSWTMMLMQPDFITPKDIDEAINIAKEKKKNLAFDRMYFGSVDFGRSIQCFHLGDYNLMNDTLAKMTAFASDNGLQCDKYTHDIYLNDMRKTKMENYKSIMRVRCFK